MIEMIMPSIAPMGVMQGSTDGPCNFSSAYARESFLRIAGSLGKEKALEGQALDLATAKSELVDRDPIGLAFYKVGKTQYFDREANKFVETDTFIAPNGQGTIGDWTGINGSGGKGEYRRIVDRANTLAKVKGDAVMIWVSLGEKSDKTNFLPHRLTVWEKIGDEVKASFYSLFGNRKSLVKTMTKLDGRGDEDVSLEDKTILKLGKHAFISHRDVFDAFVSSLNQEGCHHAEKTYIEKFRKEADLPDNARQERIRDLKDKYLKELKEKLERQYTDDIGQAVESLAPGFFRAVSEKGEVADANDQYYYRRNRQDRDVVRNVLVGYIDKSPQKDIPIIKDAIVPYGYKGEEDRVVAIEAAIIEPIAIPLILAVSNIHDEVLPPVTNGKKEVGKPNKDSVVFGVDSLKKQQNIIVISDGGSVAGDPAKLIDGQEGGQKEAGEKGKEVEKVRNETDEKRDVYFTVEDILQIVAAKLFTEDELAVLQLPVENASDTVKSESDQNFMQKSDFGSDRMTGFSITLGRLDLKVSELTQDLGVAKKTDGKGLLDGRLGEVLKNFAVSFDEGVISPISEEARIGNETVDIGKELFKILYTKRVAVSGSSKHLEVFNQQDRYKNALARLGVFLVVYFEPKTISSVKTLLSLFIFREVENILTNGLLEDFPELIYIRKRFSALSSEAFGFDGRLELVLSRLRLLLEEEEELPLFVFYLLREMVLEKDEYTVERLQTPATMRLGYFKQNKNMGIFPKRKVIYQYALLVNTGYFMTQYN